MPSMPNCLSGRVDADFSDRLIDLDHLAVGQRRSAAKCGGQDCCRQRRARLALGNQSAGV
jgi:hypothetical protein